MIDANPPSELTAMDATYACLQALDATERGRVIAWARVCFVDRPGSYVLAHQNQPLGCNDSRFDCAVTLEREETEGYMPDQAIETTDAFSPDPAIADELPGDEHDRSRLSPTDEDALSARAIPHQTDAAVPNDLSLLFETISPKTALAKALLCAWWLETREETPSWSLQDVTDAIERVGRQAQRLSTVLGIELRKPQPLIIPLPATEGGQDERYALTDAGRAHVESLLATVS